jgi:peptide/nickel transport system substrate-binding protein
MRNAQVLIKSLVILTLAVLLSGLALAAEPKRGGTLRVAYGNKVSHLDFHTAPGYEMMWVAMNIGCGLVNVTPDGQFVGDVATAWELSDDAMTWTFRLRDDAFFHDNSRVDAEAVKFSIDRLMDPETRSGMRRFYESVQSVEVVDPLTVKVHMKRPYAFFLHMLAAYRTGLVLYSPAATQAHSLKARKRGDPQAVVGCGPFRLVEWVPNTHLVMDRWEKYFKPGQPYLDRVIIRVIRDPIAQMVAFRAGEIDFIASFSPEYVQTIQAQVPEAQVLTGPETTPMVMGAKVTVPCDGRPDASMTNPRCPHPIYGDIRTRKALLCYGIDRGEIVKVALRGLATPWVGMIPPGTMDTVDVNHMCPYDPDKAKTLLEEVGYGPDNPLVTELMTNTEKAVFNSIATVVKDQLARLGVGVNIKLVDKVTWMNTGLKDGPWDTYVEDLLSLLTLDSNAYLTVTQSTWNQTRHTDVRVDEYFARYAEELDADKRRAIAKELQEFMADKLYWNVVSGSPFFQIAQPWMKGYTFNSEFEVHYETVWLDK